MMQIFDKSCLEEMKEVKDGQEYIFEYVDCGRVFQDTCINYNGEMFTKVESCCNDVKTGKALDCYYNADRYVIRNLDGTLEVA